jgi:8-amino-7-oxononanoate synthase
LTPLRSISKRSHWTLHGEGTLRHSDMAQLEKLLAASTAPRKLIVTDSIFSMDGDVAELEALARLRRRYGALLVVDEAHATLVHGEHGGGAVEQVRGGYIG